jgi:coproporphyrinogen III oxidase-like Fe-S oxidoreductase
LHARGKLEVPDQERAHAFYQLTQELTEAAGLPAYEISNHAAPGEECRHNLLYWRYGEYAGLGPGAHGRIVAGGARQATAAERNPERWAALVEARGHGLAETVALSPAEEADEAMLMGLRLSEGIDLGRLAALTGYVPAEGAVTELAGLGLIEKHGKARLRATTAGRVLLDRIVLRLASALEPPSLRGVS